MRVLCWVGRPTQELGKFRNGLGTMKAHFDGGWEAIG